MDGSAIMCNELMESYFEEIKIIAANSNEKR